MNYIDSYQILFPLAFREKQGPRDPKGPLDFRDRGERVEYQVPKVTRVLLEWTACPVVLVKRARRSVLLYHNNYISRFTDENWFALIKFCDLKDVDYLGKKN